MIVSIPLAIRRGWARPEPIINEFLAQREGWIRRHLDRQGEIRNRLAVRPSLDDGRTIPYLGEPHRVRVTLAPPRLRSSRVSRVGGDAGDELLVERAVRDRRPTVAILEAWFHARARSALAEALARHGPPLGVVPSRVTLRDTTTRWGSCSRAGWLSFSWRLILAPPAALEAVAAHELCHLRVFGHGPQFQALLTSRVPDAAAWRRWLRRRAPELYAALDPPLTPPGGVVHGCGRDSARIPTSHSPRA